MHKLTIDVEDFDTLEPILEQIGFDMEGIGFNRELEGRNAKMELVD